MKKSVLIVTLFFILGGLSAGFAPFIPEGWAQPSSPETPTEEAEDEEKETEDEDDEEGFGEEDEEGFGEDDSDAFQEIKIEIKVEDPVVDDGTSFGGFLKAELAYSYQDTDPNFPLTRKKAKLNKSRTILNLRYKFPVAENWKMRISGNSFYDAYYSQNNRKKFSKDTLNAYEAEVEFRDTFLEGLLIDSLWIKVGRQIIAWGESEGQAINDLANPRDNRELGLVDIEDARIPVLASKLSYLKGNWEWNLVAIHEFRPNKNGTESADFDNYISIRRAFTVAPEERPTGSGGDTEWLVRIFKSFNGGDVSMIAADVLEDDPYLDFQHQPSRFVPRYKRIKSYGMSGNYVVGSWLYKFEFAKKQGAAIARTSKDLAKQLQTKVHKPKSWSKKDLSQLMLGFDYTGVSDLTVTFEATIIQIEDYEDNLLNEELRAIPTVMLRYNTWNDTLHPQLFFVRLPYDNGELLRASVDYDYMDALQLSGGMAIYEATHKDGFFYPYRNNDRIFGSIKYSF